MDPTFGSFGDFLSIAALIKDIVEALNDSRGSSKKYQELINGLGILNTAMEQVRQLCTSQRFLADIESTLVTALEQAVAKVWQSLEDFHAKIWKYSASLSPGGSGNVVKDAFRKIQYKLEEKDVQDFHQEILEYKTSLELLLQLAQMHVNQRNHDELVKQNDRNENMLHEQIRVMQSSWRRIGNAVLGRLDSLSTLGTEILSVILTTSTGIREIQPIIAEIHSFIMRLERPLSDPHFVLEDAMGDSHPIYMKTITSWDTFEFVLQQRFKGKRGARRVRRGRYVLEDPSTGIILDRSWDWEDLFMRRQRIFMRLFCKELISKLNDEKLSRCPWCKTMWSSRDDEDMPCLKCKRSFARLFDMKDDDDMENSSSHANSSPKQPGQPMLGARPSQESRKSDRFLKHAKGDGHNWARSMNSDSDSESDEEDIKCFDRIILISQRIRAMPSRPRTMQTAPPRRASASTEAPTNSKATEADARKHAIPSSYSLKNWDPNEEPILLLGSVFDGNSLGKWVYDWVVWSYGSSSPRSEMAGDLWLLLIQLTGKIKSGEEALPRIREIDDKEILEDFIMSGERMLDKLRRLLKDCERPMLKAASLTKKGQQELGSNSGVAFVETLFEREKELEKTERFMQTLRLWNLRFDANCDHLVKRTSPLARSHGPTSSRPRSPASISFSRPRDTREPRMTHYQARPSSRYTASDRYNAEYGSYQPWAGRTTERTYPSYKASQQRPATRAHFRASQRPSFYYGDSVSPNEDEYVEVNGDIYVIPAKSRPSESRYERDGYSYNRDGSYYTREVSSPRPQTRRRETRARDTSPAPGSSERGSAAIDGRSARDSAGISEINDTEKSNAEGSPEDPDHGEGSDESHLDGGVDSEEALHNKVEESLWDETDPGADSDKNDRDDGTIGDHGTGKKGVKDLLEKTPAQYSWGFGLASKKKKKKKKAPVSFTWLDDYSEEEVKDGDGKHGNQDRSGLSVEKVVEDFKKETPIDGWWDWGFSSEKSKKKKKKKVSIAFTWDEDGAEDEVKNIDEKHDNTGEEGLDDGHGNGSTKESGNNHTAADGFNDAWSAWAELDTKKRKKHKSEEPGAATTPQHTQDREDKEAHAPDGTSDTELAKPAMGASLTWTDGDWGWSSSIRKTDEAVDLRPGSVNDQERAPK